MSDATARFLDEIVAALPPGETSAVVPVAPCPASRPRVGKYGTYYQGPYGKFVTQAPPVFAAHLPPPTDELGFLVLRHYIARPKSTKLSAPRGDADNFNKASADAIQKAGVLFHDDVQCVGMLSTKQWADEPRIEVTWIPMPRA
jgi:Holliday junction resolvase RusA-like endonuclease